MTYDGGRITVSKYHVEVYFRYRILELHGIRAYGCFQATTVILGYILGIGYYICVKKLGPSYW